MRMLCAQSFIAGVGATPHRVDWSRKWVWGFQFWVDGFGFGSWCEARVEGIGFRVYSFGFEGLAQRMQALRQGRRVKNVGVRFDQINLNDKERNTPRLSLLLTEREDIY